MQKKNEVKYETVSKNGTKVHDSIMNGGKDRYVVYGILTPISRQYIFHVFKASKHLGRLYANWEVRGTNDGAKITCCDGTIDVPGCVADLVTKNLPAWMGKMQKRK